MRTKRKRKHECVVKTTISLPPKCYDSALERVRDDGYSGLSSYIQFLIRQAALAQSANR